MQLGIYFEGRQIILPGAYARTKVEAFNLQRPPLFKRLAVIAPALGGVPKGFTRITSGTEAAKKLKGGVGLELVDLALDPSREVPGAGEILFYRVNAAVPASLDLGNLRLTAKPEYAGLYGNGFRAKRELHPEGYHLLWVEDPQAGVLEQSPPLGPALELRYYGSGTPTAQITTDSEGQKHLVLTGGAPYENHDIRIGGRPKSPPSGTRCTATTSQPAARYGSSRTATSSASTNPLSCNQVETVVASSPVSWATS